MSNPTPHLDLAVEMARLRTELHATNTNVSRIADSLERALNDHEQRLRRIEAEQLRAQGVIKLVAWLGAPTAAALVIFLSQRG